MHRMLPRAFAVLAWLVGLGVVAVVAGIVGFLAARGGALLGPKLLFGDAPALDVLLGRQPAFHGLWAALAGTLVLVVGAALIAVPLGVASGIYLAEYGGGRWGRAFGFAVDVLAGVPSIIMGLFGFGLILFLRRTLLPDANTCLLLAMGCLALLVLPYLVRTTESALRGLPASIRLAGPSLGLSPWQTIWHVLLPAASRGILSGVVLAVGRAAEDTAVIILTGVVATAGLPGRLTDKFQALPFTIYCLAAEHRDQGELNLAFGAALLLLSLTATLFLLASWLHHSLERRLGTRI